MLCGVDTGKSKSTTQGAFTGWYPRSKIAAFTKSVSSPNFKPDWLESERSKYAERCSNICFLSVVTGSAVFVDQFIIWAPHPSWMCPKQWSRGRHLSTALRRCGQPALSPRHAVSRMPAGGPWVSIKSISGHDGTGFSGLTAAIFGLGLNRSTSWG